jgi:autotransporter translocation and assembly factor TamB
MTPDLRLRVDRSRAFLSGDLRVHEGLFELRGPVANGVSVSRDVVRLDTPPEKPRRFALQSDVRTIIEPGFTLRTTQLETTLSGDLRLSASPSQPAQLFGELQVLGGVLRAYGQALRVDRGSVGFVGDPGNPDLNLAAVRDIRSEQLRVGVRVVGSLQAPQLNLFSEPQRPERETLSYLLRGRGPDAGAGADGTAMALALGATAINQSGLLESLNSVPGLSQVSLGAEGSDDETAATISAYVGERLFLSYGMGIYEPVNALTARLYLRSRLWLEVVSRLENSFDLYYRFDRD